MLYFITYVNSCSRKLLCVGECSGFVGAFPAFTRSHYEMCLYEGGFKG